MERKNNSFISPDFLSHYFNKKIIALSMSDNREERLHSFIPDPLNSSFQREIQGETEKAAGIIAGALISNPGNTNYLNRLNELAAKYPGQAAGIKNNLIEFESWKPRTFTIETALACNLKCPECAIGSDIISRKKGYLSYDNFKVIADKIKPYCNYLYLHLWGEPMLNKDIIEMIKYSAGFSRTNISTNAILLDEKKAESLITSGVSDIIVSIDGYTDEVYKKYRVGGEVEKAFNGLKLLAGYNRKYGGRVNIAPQFIVFKHNQHEMNDFARACEEIGLRAEFKAPYLRSDDSMFEVSDIPRFVRPEYNDLDTLKNAMRECVNPRDVFTIHLDGSVVICCHDYDKETCFGNIFEESVEDIWNKPEYRKFRWDIFSGNAPGFCLEKCMTYINGTLSKKDEDKKVSDENDVMKVNLCGGASKLGGFINVDIHPSADIVLDLEKELLPFKDKSVDQLVCISAINYFTRERAAQIIRDVHRVMKPDGMVRFGVQDLQLLAKKYLERDHEFFFQKLENGNDRFPGRTFADKFNNWFYGFATQGKSCKYVYDFETLALLFEEAGFKQIKEKKFLESEFENIDKIDNRPEQMFFLEARIKEADIESFDVREDEMEKFREYWQKGREDKAWNILLQLMEKGNYNADIAKFGIELCKREENWDDAINICSDYQQIHGKNEEIKLITEELKNLKEQATELPSEIQQNINSITSKMSIPSKPAEDEVHLSAGIKWLERAFVVKGMQGVSAMYDLMKNKWFVSYPETTGYIIPTLLEYYKITGRNLYLNYARLMGDWEIDLQWNSGGIGEPVGIFGKKPRVFNTSQVMLGWLALYHETEDQRYLNAAVKAGNWLTGIQNKDGSWSSNTYKGAKSYHIRSAWALLELSIAGGNEKFAGAAFKNLDKTMSLGLANGWFRETSLMEPGKPWTHLIGYTLTGLLKIYLSEINKERTQKILPLLIYAADEMINYFQDSRHSIKDYLGLPGTFDDNWKSSDNYSCITGDAQLEFFIRRIGLITGKSTYTDIADELLDSIKQVQFIGQHDPEDMFGGLPGSFPVDGSYRPFALPNWGVKFFADSLIQKISPDSTRFLS